MVNKILCLNPDDRLNLDEIINHQRFRVTPSLRPFLNNINYNDKSKLKIHLIHGNSQNDKKINYINSKKKVLIKLIKNDENSFKETNINTNRNNNNIISKGFY